MSLRTRRSRSLLKKRLIAVVGGKITGFVDTFTGTSVSWIGYGTIASIISGRVVIPCTSTFSALTTDGTYDLTDSAAFIEFVQSPNTGNGGTSAQFDLKLSNGNEILFSKEGPNLVFREVAGGVINQTTVTFDDAIHRWWRIRESGGTIYWETSPDSVSWTTRRSKTRAVLSPTAVSILLISGYINTEPSPGTAIFDNLNNADSSSVTPSGLDLYKKPNNVTAQLGQYPQLSKITDYATASWLGDWYPNPQSVITTDKNNAAGKTLLYVLYAIPFRDNGNFSAGGFQTDQEYVNWINSVATGIGTADAIVILEPDALGLIGDLDSAAQTRRYNLISGAVTRLKQCPNLKLFIDMGMWIEPSPAASRLQSANVAAADGVAINTSAFNYLQTCYDRGNSYIQALSSLGINGKKFVVDTSRNGNGPLTADYPGSNPWISTNQPWCNPPGRALGLSPRIPTGQANCYALLWIKTAGESDGNFPSVAQNTIFSTNAPNAGEFWAEYALAFVANSP